MLKRQQSLLKKRRNDECERSFHLATEVKKLQEIHPRFSEQIYLAADTLNAWGFQLFINELKLHINYTRVEKDGDGYAERSINNKVVSRKAGATCTCCTNIAFMIQCRHQLCSLEGKFDIKYFDKRWMKDITSVRDIRTLGKFHFPMSIS